MLTYGYPVLSYLFTVRSRPRWAASPSLASSTTRPAGCIDETRLHIGAVVTLFIVVAAWVDGAHHHRLSDTVIGMRQARQYAGFSEQANLVVAGHCAPGARRYL